MPPDCFAALAMTGSRMRYFLPLTTVLLLTACATRPQQPAPQPVSVAPSPSVRTAILGLTAQELVGHFGNPALQVREGTSLKLQFRSRLCVLDAYLYPPPTGPGPARVAHVDARAPSGSDTDQAACISALENPS
jgi:hypothetical protein